MKRILLSAALAGGFLFSTASYAQTTAATGPETITTIADNGLNDLLVYPNPVFSSTRIVLDQVPGSSVFIDVIDMNGVVERTFQYAPGSYQLDVDMSNLPAGLYSVCVSGKYIGYHNLKIVKE